MKRRTLIALPAALGVGLALSRERLTSTFASPVPELPLDICSGSTPGARPSVQTVALTNGLHYEGTHILAYGAMRRLAEIFQQRTGQTVNIRGGGCDDAILALKAQVADFGGLCCPIESTPLKALPHLVVAEDDKALLVHPSNPVDKISALQAMRLARGEISDWRELGGHPGQVALVVRKHCPDFAEPVRGLLVGSQHRWSHRGIFVTTDEKIVETTARFENGLGIVSWVYAHRLVKAGLVKALAVDGQLPGSGGGSRYPLTGPLTLALRQWQPKRHRGFIEFVFSAEGQKVLAETLRPRSPGQSGYTRGRFPAVTI